MTRKRVPLTIAWAMVVCGAIAVAADLQDRTRRAYDEYEARATRSFVERACDAARADSAASTRAAPRDGEVIAEPASEDGILIVPGGLVHHWIGSTFIAGVTLQDVLDVSYAYNDYPTVYKPVLASRLLGHDGNMFRVKLRIKESGGGLSAVLDVTSRVVYAYPDDRSAYSLAMAEEIREIRNAGTPNERSLDPGHDSGYLWRAATFTNLVARDRGVFVETEALGLSRGFPAFMAWLIEPVARRLGRQSVERSLQEFTQAVRMRAQKPRASNGIESGIR
jgi:hypothetical protein